MLAHSIRLGRGDELGVLDEAGYDGLDVAQHFAAAHCCFERLAAAVLGHCYADDESCVYFHALLDVAPDATSEPLLHALDVVDCRAEFAAHVALCACYCCCCDAAFCCCDAEQVCLHVQQIYLQSHAQFFVLLSMVQGTHFDCLQQGSQTQLQFDQTDLDSQHRYSPFAQWLLPHYWHYVLDQWCWLAFEQIGFLTMHMDLQQLLLPQAQTAVVQMFYVAVLLVVFLQRFFLPQVQQRGCAIDRLLLNAIQKIHNPTLFRLNELLQYVHSLLVQNLQDYTKFRNVGFLSVGVVIQLLAHLKFAQGKLDCDVFHSVRMPQFQRVLRLELRHDVHAGQSLPLYA